MDFGMDYFLSLLQHGKEHARNAHALYPRYKMDGGEQSISIFQRFLRMNAVEARRQGIKVVGDNNGYYIAKNEAEWEAYTRTQLNSVYSKIQSIAMCEGKTVSQIIRRKLGGGKKKIDNSQLVLFH